MIVKLVENKGMDMDTWTLFLYYRLLLKTDSSRPISSL